MKNPPHFTKYLHFQLCFLFEKSFENKILIILFERHPYFLIFYLDIIENSLNSGEVSPFLKTAIIFHILKKNLDTYSLRNNSPISHLSLLRKIL